ncbi:DEAD/DEAH box helicase [Streptomyces sp. NBC_01803]|uniref:DEAD/DEAH box helicase n=1 Tax=Streptomyces sp. NBC_01803 TaxID=2975946 RepID=UPI002DD7C582|nr:Helicase associated domain protein [Streptomyces sp. NBC_01803]WSA47458.1 Helicase associated domain protein [Streptomyces sp. NBC_01803]WSA47790.1 Helicase associated domain protein [Streptomyces sp. NBC_01803]
MKRRDHQIEATEAAARALDIPPGKRIPAGGLRATVVMPCGSGKTLVAADTARRVARNGRVLVLVPTLDLLTQTVLAWQAAGHKGPAVAVCSLTDDPALWAAKVRVTTSAPQLALWHGSGPVTVYATYSSLPVLTSAFEGSYGLPMAPFDLVVVDEAHRTSGSQGKAWADVHNNGLLPSLRRLYLTATPRVWQERPSWEVREGVRDPLPEELAASMDDPAIFGPVVYRMSLAMGVARGLLARYQIIVVELADPQLPPGRLYGPERREEEIRGLRLGALQAAMLKTAREHDLKTMITFHHRTVEAQAFAAGLPAVAERLHQADPERYPARVWTGWLKGDHDSAHRREVLGEFGTRAGLAILCNCKVLGEGVDIRAVDSVAFLDPKGSPVDIVQAIGRALRQKPGEGKLASLIVPVFLAPGEQPQDMFTSASYKPLTKVLQGLRAHDEQALELLAIPQTNALELSPGTDIGPPPEDGEDESRMLLRFSSRRDPALVAEWIAYNVIDTERQDWERGLAALRTYAKREGHARVPFSHVESAYPLGQWTADQRKTFNAGAMPSRRADRLEKLGMVWDERELAWEETLAVLRAYYQEYGTLAAPRSATVLDRPVGMMLANLRRDGGLGKDPARAARRAEQLAGIDPYWNPAWPIEWQRTFAGVQACIDGGAEPEDILPGVTFAGVDVGTWLKRQRQAWKRLSDGQRELLEGLGVTPLQTPSAAPAEAATGNAGAAPVPAARKHPAGRNGTFERGLAAARQYLTREGHLTVPRGHVEHLVIEDGTDGGERQEQPETVAVRLGVWRSNMRARRDKLTPQQQAALDDIGL